MVTLIWLRGESGDLVGIPLACCFPGCTDEEADGRPRHAGFPGDANRLDHVTLGIGSFLHRAAQGRDGIRVKFIGIGRLVPFKPRSEFICVLKNLID